MRCLLDTNAWVGHLRQSSPMVTRQLKRHSAADVVLCSVVIGELLFGVERSGVAHRAANLALVAQLRQQYVSLSFDDPAADWYGPIRAQLAVQGAMIGANDLMIAAIAQANNCILVTHNTAEFSRVAGLVIEDWQIP